MRSSKRALSSRRVSSGREIAFGLFGEDGEHVDALAGAHDVDLGLLALVGCTAELHDRGHVDGLDELVEAHGGRVVHAGIGGADGGVEAVGGHLVGAAGLIGLFCGGLGRKLSSGPASVGATAACGGAWPATGWRRGCGTLFSLGGWVGVGAEFAVQGELAAIGDDEGLVLFRHGYTLSEDSDAWRPGLRCSGRKGKRDRDGDAAGILKGSAAVESFAADVAEGQLDSSAAASGRGIAATLVSSPICLPSASSGEPAAGRSPSRRKPPKVR